MHRRRYCSCSCGTGRGLFEKVRLSDLIALGWWASDETHGIEAFGSLSVDCHDLDMVPQVLFILLPPLELLTSFPKKSHGRKTRARLSSNTPVPHCRDVILSRPPIDVYVPPNCCKFNILNSKPMPSN